MTALEPRTDGMSNTLTSVQKDNLVAVYDAYNKTVTKRTESGTVQAHHGQQLFHVVENVYDAYNHKMRDDGTCGTLTASGNVSTTPCGTFMVIENEKTDTGDT